MKTNIFYTALLSISLVLFVSFASIANTATNYTSNLTKNLSAITTETFTSVASSTNDFDFSYLRFDLTKFTGSNAIVELPSSSFDYLRFDVNNYIKTNSPDASEVPVNNGFEYLRFDANKFIVNESAENIELSVNEFDYLRFDINTYESADKYSIMKCL